MCPLTRSQGPRVPATYLLMALVAMLGAAACGAVDDGGAKGATPRKAGQTPSDMPLTQTRATFEAAARALLHGDHGAYRAALPTRGAAADKAIGDFYRVLSRLPWRSFEFVVTPIPGHRGRYLVQASGALMGAGPSDRLAGERVVDTEYDDGGMLVVGDATPDLARRQHLMAFQEPVVARRPGLVLVSERKASSWRVALAKAAPAARVRLRRLGIAADDGVLVAVYSSGAQMKAAFAHGLAERRMRFFAHKTPRISSAEWRRYDIAVVGPSLPDDAGAIERVLAHEWTHALTVSWFLKTEHAPTLLLEGLAEAVDGDGDGDRAALREELLSGNRLWPVEDALATSNLWAGNDYDEILLVYTMAESLIRYVVDRWGIQALEPFCAAVADSDLSEAGLSDATQDSLGVSWAGFTAGWKRYVLSGW